MTTIQRSSTTSMLELDVLFAQVAQHSGDAARDTRDAAFEREVHAREQALAEDAHAADMQLAAGLSGAVGAGVAGACQIVAGCVSTDLDATAAAAAQKRWEGGGAIAAQVGRVAALGFEKEAASAKNQAGLHGISAEKAKKERDDMNDLLRDSRRLRDALVAQMKQALDDEKRVAERIRG